MNKVVLIGRLTRDPEVRKPQGEGTPFARFSVAVNRKFKNSNGEYDADFLNCISFGKTAEFVEKYFSKGMRIGIVGRIQTGSYTKEDGTKVYTTDIVAEEVEFVENKGSNSQNQTTQKKDDEFMNIPDTDIDELPWS